MFENINHLCFDKDGVLIDVHAYWKHTSEIRANFIKNKLMLNNDEELKLIDSMGIDLISGKIKKGGPVGYHPRSIIIRNVKLLLSTLSYEISLNQIEKYFLIIDNEQQEKDDFNIKLLDGVKDFILNNVDKYNMTVFTSDRKKNAEHALTKLGIISYFRLVLGGDSVNKSKPNPEGINSACNFIGVKPSNTAYITDTRNDLVMAKNAKLPLKIGILTGLGNKSDLNDLSDLVFKDFYHFSKYLYANK